MTDPQSAPPSGRKAPRRRATPAVAEGATPAAAPPANPSIDLALQGGGSHGAFTWGVLDALLEDGRLGFDGVSGTSAGAMNAAVMAVGYARDGREGARGALRAFWNDVGGVPGCLGTGQHLSTALPAGVPVSMPGGAGLPGWQGVSPQSAALAAPFTSPFASPFGLSSQTTWPSWLFNFDTWPLYGLWDAWLKTLSPSQINPLNLNPLRQILVRHIDEALLRDGPLKVFVTATAVSTGQPKVFSGAALSIDALLASACLPQLYQAVEIDGEPYWDGGFAGNPAIWPLIYGTGALDVLLVQINPLVRAGSPSTALEIADRVNEITFNASLVAEMRAIAFVQKLIAQGQVSSDEYKQLRLHRVADEDGLAPFDASSKLNTNPQLLNALFTLGRGAAQRWLVAHFADVGVRNSTPIEPVYLAPRAAP